MDRLLPALDPVDQPVDATLGGELAALLEPLVPACVARNEDEGQVEAAGAHDRVGFVNSVVADLQGKSIRPARRGQA
jgi:hypothetical protein